MKIYRGPGSTSDMTLTDHHPLEYYWTPGQKVRFHATIDTSGARHTDVWVEMEEEDIRTLVTSLHRHHQGQAKSAGELETDLERTVGFIRGMVDHDDVALIRALLRRYTRRPGVAGRTREIANLLRENIAAMQQSAEDDLDLAVEGLRKISSLLSNHREEVPLAQLLEVADDIASYATPPRFSEEPPAWDWIDWDGI